MSHPAPSIESPQAARRGRQDFWLGWKTGNRHGTEDAKVEGYATGYGDGWVARDRASLDDAAQQWAALGKATTAAPTLAELQTRRSDIDKTDIAWRCRSREELIEACARSWGAQW